MDNVIDQVVLLAVSDDLEDAIEIVLPEFPADKLADFKEGIAKLLHDTYKSDFIIEEGDDEIGDEEDF